MTALDHCPRCMTALTAAGPTFSMQTGLHGNALRICRSCHDAAVSKIRIEVARYKRRPSADPFSPPWPTTTPSRASIFGGCHDRLE
jgi:hypothetical protein